MRKLNRALCGSELACASAMLVLAFSPWISSMGESVFLLGLGDRLEGVNRLVSLFTDDSRISEAYALSRYAGVLPWLAGACAVCSLLAATATWTWLLAGLADLAAGGAALYASWYVRGFLEGKWFHHLEYGGRWMAAPAAALLLTGLIRLVSGYRR